jgi:hypothetical protein
MKVRIYEAGRDEMHKGWIRISKELDLRKGIPNGAYVIVSANNRKVYCQIRGTLEKAGCVEMNEWYRNALGWTDTPNEEIELTVKKVGFRRIVAFAQHPDDIVRVSIGLGMISVGLGILSIILAFSISVTGIASWVFYLVLGPTALMLVVMGFYILLGKSHKPID